MNICSGEHHPVEPPDRAGASARGWSDSESPMTGTEGRVLWFCPSDQTPLLCAADTSGGAKNQFVCAVENVPNAFTYVIHIVIFY